nr:hypothetical protein [Tanacetum cinerariifolium]
MYGDRRQFNADKHIPGWNDGLSSLENAGLEPYGHLGWKGDGDRNNWALSWTDMLRTDGAMVLAGEPPSDMVLMVVVVMLYGGGSWC